MSENAELIADIKDSITQLTPLLERAQGMFGESLSEISESLQLDIIALQNKPILSEREKNKLTLLEIAGCALLHAQSEISPGDLVKYKAVHLIMSHLFMDSFE